MVSRYVSSRRVVSKTAAAAVYIIIVMTSMAVAFPFFWMIANSIKTKEEIWAAPPQLFPAVPQWSNYVDALSDGIFFQYMGNSMYVSAILTVIVLFNSAMFAYAITQIRFRGRGILFLLIMMTYIMPSASTYVPCYVILARLNLIDTHLGYIVSCAASVFNIFFFRQTFLQINRSIIEAARIDGAGHWTILWKIMAPMSTSAFATLGILSFIDNYNSYLWPSLIIKTRAKYFVSLGLRAFFSGQGAYGIKWGSIMAACCVVILPLLLIFAFGERRIALGLTSDSAIKE
ncbi:MAG: carbohydrate ABC transporter permease [Treponema sp.]|jgi:multiple sugar transport system permease protein|nr:carbohydrate ABC transporter permease [Treponema sp.]